MKIILSEKKPLVLTLSAFSVLIIGYIDYITGYRLGFSIFYLIPICLAAWYVGRDAGLAMSVFGVLIWILADLYAREITPSFFVLFWNATIRAGYFIIITLMLSRLKLSFEKEAKLARVDFLTGIPNRYDFNEIFFLEMERAKRSRRPLTLAYLDCDNFKKINDTLGHEQGDLLLRELSNVLMQNTRKTDKVARLSGDEFVVLLPETTEEQAREVVLRLHVKLLTVMELYQWPVTFSIGCVTFEDIPLSTKDAINEADKMMYQAKQNGKNQLATKTIHSVITKK